MTETKDVKIAMKDAVTAALMCLCPGAALMATAEGAAYAAALAACAVIFTCGTLTVLKRVIPEGALPSFSIVVSTFFALAASMLAHAYLPEAYFALGAYVPVLMAAGAVLGGACSVEPSGGEKALLTALTAGALAVALAVLTGSLCELLSAGTVFGIRVLESTELPAYFSETAGALLLLAFAAAALSRIGKGTAPKNAGRLLFIPAGAELGYALAGAGLGEGAAAALTAAIVVALLLCLTAPLHEKFSAKYLPGPMRGLSAAILATALMETALHGFTAIF